MASTLTFTPSFSAPIRASSARKPDPNPRKPTSSAWWSPIFGWSSDPDYINNKNTDSTAKTNETSAELEIIGSTKKGSNRFALGCFTEEKAKELRKKMMEGNSFHDVMYHSAIASRLASDLSGRPEN